MVKQLIHKTIKEFLGSVTDDDIYNEFSMQHELGIKLREAFETHNNDYNRNFVVQFERNRGFFGINDPTPIVPEAYIPKSEIDIVVYDKNGTDDKKNWEKYAIELKFPLEEQGKEPERMYEFYADISFCEKLRDNGFEAAFAVVLTNNPNIYSYTCGRSSREYPYYHFRVPNPNPTANKFSISMPTQNEYEPTGAIRKPTGAQPKIGFAIKGEYNEKWESAQNITNGKYYIISI